MTPGLALIFCCHEIWKGFTAMTTAENPEIFTKFLTRRLQRDVQTKRRIFIYDNACNLHKNALKRDAQDISRFRIFTDRHHWKNHTGCSESYNSDRWIIWKMLIVKSVSRRIDLRWNYMTKVKLFFILNNFEEKNIF